MSQSRRGQTAPLYLASAWVIQAATARPQVRAVARVLVEPAGMSGREESIVSMANWAENIQGREEQRQLKRQALLRTAARTFNETGFHQTTLEDVANKLGVTKPALYYYVKNKDEILFECNQLALEQMQSVLEVVQAQKTNALEKLRVLMTHYVRIITEDFGTCLILSSDQTLTQENRQKLRAYRVTFDNAVRQLIEEGIADRSIAPCDPKMVTFALFGAFNWIPHWYQESGDLKPEEIAEHFLAVFTRGLLPRS